MESPLDTLLDYLTRNRPPSMTTDEMTHSVGPGISQIQYWPADGILYTYGPWLWRVLWQPRRGHPADRVAYGMSDSQEEARLAASEAATDHARRRGEMP